MVTHIFRQSQKALLKLQIDFTMREKTCQARNVAFFYFWLFTHEPPRILPLFCGSIRGGNIIKFSNNGMELLFLI